MTSPVERLFRRIQHMLAIGRTTTVPVDTATVQTVQIKTNDLVTRDGVPVVYNYGFTACLPLGSDVIVLNVSGDSSNGVIIGTAHQASRPVGLEEGQVMIYDQAGSSILFNNGNSIIMTAKAAVRVVAPVFSVSGNMDIGEGATGTFVSGDGQTITVRNGAISNIK